MKTLTRTLSFAALVAASSVLAAPPPLEVFATGVLRAQGIVPSPAGGYVIVNTPGSLAWVPAGGGAGTPLVNIPTPPATTCTMGVDCLSLRDGTFLPREFGDKAGQFLVVGGVASTNTPSHASTVDGYLVVTPYASQASSLWSASIPVTGFGRYHAGVVVVNQGSGQGLRNGGVDYFAPDGTVSLLAALPDAEVPYGAALAPENEAGGILYVSDARSGRIYSINPSGRVRLFATVPSATALRQIAVAPGNWGRYSQHIFVSLAANEVAVLDRTGRQVAKITGLIAPRALHFTEVNDIPSLLIGETGGTVSTGLRILRAGPEHLQPAS